MHSSWWCKAEFSPVDGVVRMNNRGTDQVGPAFVLGQFFVNGYRQRRANSA